MDVDRGPTLERVQQHPAILETHTSDWPDEPACEACARAIATCSEVRRARIALEGPLGAGKTAFARALLRALGVKGRIKSPTFALLEPYEVGGLKVAHVDLYRMEDPLEFDDAGLRDAIADAGLALVEWPERAGPRLPPMDLRLRIEVIDDDSGDDGSRRVVFDAYSTTGVALLHAARAGAMRDHQRTLQRAP
jgi:tRNA threonylcarbamoyladenosine biosynthesis protein TsaE